MNSKKSVVLKAAQKLLAPLVRLLVHSGVSHLEFNEMLKKTYIDVCFRYFSLPGRKSSVSRVAVLSGLSRKEVVKLTESLQEDDVNHDFTRSINRASRVLGAWLQDSDYLDNEGVPLELDKKGSLPSFKSLVKRYAGDVTYGAILDELLRISAVTVTETGRVKLLTQGYLPVKSDNEKINIIGTSTSDLLTTAVHNVTHPEDARFQREVVYAELSQSAIEEFKLVSQEKSMGLLLELNQWLADKKKLEKQLGRLQRTSRTGIGIYYIETETDDDNKCGNENDK